MTTEIFAQPKHVTLPARQRWEAPAIVLERSLQVSAQDGPPNPMGGAPAVSWGRWARRATRAIAAFSRRRKGNRTLVSHDGQGRPHGVLREDRPELPPDY